MKTTLILIGKTTSPALSQLINDYAGRIAHFTPFNIETIPELRNTKSLSQQQQKEQEGSKILQSIKPSDHVVLLDEHGQQFRSIDFARYVQRTLTGGATRTVFVIGGPYGFSDDVYKRANNKLSLSPMTFSHQMIRLLFVEQYYRAHTILNHLPYHHE